MVSACWVSSAQAQTGEYIVLGQNPGMFAKIQGGAVQCIWSTVNCMNENAVAVPGADVRTVGAGGQGQQGAGYDFCDGDNGDRFPNGGNIFDATSDGEHIFAQVFNGPVLQFDLNWTNPHRLFTPTGATFISIAFDSSDNTLWTGGWGAATIKHWALDGTDLGGFTPNTTLNTALAVDQADGTIWESDRSVGGQFFQYDKSGNLLQTLNLGDLSGFNILGGDMAPGPPSTGACCFADGSCQDGMTNQDCTNAGGIAFNRDQNCDQAECLPTVEFHQDFIQDQGADCPPWEAFQAQLTDDIDYLTVTLSGTFDTEGFTCTDPDKVKAIAAALNTNSTVSIDCDGHTWRTGPCGGGLELTAIGSICTSQDPGYTVRPCISPGNPNWGGVNTRTHGAPSQTIWVVFTFNPPGPKCVYTVVKAKRKSDPCGVSCDDCPVSRGDKTCTIDCADNSDCPAKVKGFFRCQGGGACKIKATLDGCGDCPNGAFLCP